MTKYILRIGRWDKTKTPSSSSLVYTVNDHAMILTPPYHFSTVACPFRLNNDGEKNQILYRGSIPASRNLPFVNKLNLKTVIYLRKKEFKEDEDVSRWSKKRQVDLQWIKVDKLSEESLGIGKNEMGEVLKLLLDSTLYPIYLADIDGISHTTLVIACLRKIQGWSIESIISEVSRFEPEYEDYPFLSFINSYLTNSSSSTSTSTSDTLNLPIGPYPIWLWPVIPPSLTPAPTLSLSLTRTNTIGRESGKERENSGTFKEKERERTTSSSNNHNHGLPFPHPLSTRKHPTMRLIIPPVPQPSSSSATTSAISSSIAPTTTVSPPSALSRVNSRRDTSRATVNSPNPLLPQDNPGLMAAATSLLSAGLSGVVGVLTGDTESGLSIEPAKLNRMVSFHDERERSESSLADQSSVSGSPERLSRSLTRSSTMSQTDGDNDGSAIANDEDYEEDDDQSGETNSEETQEDEEDFDDEDDDEDEDEDEEDDDEVEPTSLHISALDLAGYG